MEQLDLLRFIVRILEEKNLRYFVTGSTATIFYGEPRFTNDIDIVVELPLERVNEFCRQFPPADFYLDTDAATDAVSHKTQFNIIQPTSGLKVDVIIPESNAFNASRFNRVRQLQAADDLSVYFSSPEDVIIKKMDYYRQGNSDKHLRDIAGVLKANRNQLDMDYLEKWSKTLGLEEIWNEIQQQFQS